MVASTYAGNAMLDLLLRGVGFTAPARVYASLHTSDPGLTGANEVTTVAWPAYARQDPADGAAIGTGFSPAASKATASLKQLLWPANDGAGDVTVTHVCIWDAATGGNCFIIGALTMTKVVSPSDELVIKIGELQFSVT